MSEATPRRLAASALGVLLTVAGARGELVPCRHAADHARIRDAVEHIRRSVDPCGESPQVVGLLERIERCATARYEICTDPGATRNVTSPRGADRLGTIVWNPELRSELEPGCDGDAGRPVARDPIASLLHELAHAADDCEGRNPGERELEAVRIENIYRRAAGLCQRSAYGDARLETEWQMLCTPEQCACSLRVATPGPEAPPAVLSPGALRHEVADSAAAAGEIVVDPARPRADASRSGNRARP